VNHLADPTSAEGQLFGPIRLEPGREGASRLALRRLSSRAREAVSRSMPGRNPFPLRRSNFHRRRQRPEIFVWYHFATDQRWSLVMSAILTLVYRAYCLARLLEMRKHHLVR
jgi:hypothetical protein